MADKESLKKYLKENLDEDQIVALWNFYDRKYGVGDYEIAKNKEYGSYFIEIPLIQKLYGDSKEFNDFIDCLDIPTIDERLRVIKAYEDWKEFDNVNYEKVTWDEFLKDAKSPTLNELCDAKWVYYKTIYDYQKLTAIKNLYDVIDLNYLAECLLNEKELHNTFDFSLLDDDQAEDLENLINSLKKEHSIK